MENFANNNTSANNWKNNNKGYNNGPKVSNNNTTNNGEQLCTANTVSGGFSTNPISWVKSNSKTCAIVAGSAIGAGCIGFGIYKAYKFFTKKKSSKKSEEKPQEAAAANDAKGK